MLNPSVVELLVGVAETLDADVVGELPPGVARDQLQAGVAIIKRVARALPMLTPYLLEDIADLVTTLDALGVPAPTEAVSLPPSSAALSLTELFRVDLDLRETLATLADTDGLDGERAEVLRAALGRLAEREVTLRLSPWGR